MKDIIESDSFLSILADDIKEDLLYIDTISKKFKHWFVNNQKKIVSKLDNAEENEDMYDVISELICAANILAYDGVSELIYEPNHQLQRSPDFKAILINEDVYFEVKRIRRNSAEEKRDQFVSLFWEKVKTKIHKNFGLALMMDSIESEKDFQQLIDRIDEIINYLQRALSDLSENNNENIEVSLDEIVEGFGINVYCIPDNKRNNSKVRNYGGVLRIPYTDKEFRKFGDIIFNKTQQLVDGEKNVFFIHADNNTHEELDFFDSISSINELINKNNIQMFKNKGYKSIKDFLNKSKKISVIILMDRSQRCKLWINEDSEKSLSEELKKYFIN